MAEYNARTGEWSGLTNITNTAGSAITTGNVVFNTGTNGYYPLQRQLSDQPVNYYTYNNLLMVGTAAEAEKEELKMKDTKEYKFALYEESRGFIGIFKTEDEATRQAEKNLAQDKSGRYTIFQAKFQVDAEPIKTVRTEIK